MKNFRISVALALIIVGAGFIPLSFAAKQKLTPEQEEDARRCDDALIKCWNDCAKRYSSKAGPLRACEHACEAYWENCLRYKGVWIGRVKPRKPVASTETVGVERTTPTPRPSATLPGDREGTGNRKVPETNATPRQAPGVNRPATSPKTMASPTPKTR